MLMARNVHMSTCSPGVNSDGFMNMSPVSTSGRQPLALTFAATESEHPASATTGHSVRNAEYERVATVLAVRALARRLSGSARAGARHGLSAAPWPSRLAPRTRRFTLVSAEGTLGRSYDPLGRLFRI